ncbi:energy-coupling factor transporter ATPase [Halanaerobaculum tunisiense]
MPLIKISDVSYRYNQADDWVLQEIDLEIEAGEFVAIVGHNGSGKSTLAKMLNGLLVPKQGRVQVADLETSNQDQLWEIRQQVGMVFQNPDNQLVANIVEEDVAFGPENLGLESAVIQQRVTAALQRVGMEELRREAPHDLSGGQKQRVAIAGILAMHPECLVLDEPTAMLDPVGREQVMSTIQDLNRNLDMTVVHITHFMQEAIQADRIIVLEQGEVALEGTPQQIFSQVDQLQEYNLDLPQVTELAVRLQQAGVDIATDIHQVDRLVTELCSLK